MSADLEKTIRELKDRQDILDCLVRYCRGMDRMDRALAKSAYHPDALDDHGDYVGPVDGLIDWAFGLHEAGQRRTQHRITNHYCELDGDTAHAETYWSARFLNRKPPYYNDCFGRYLDKLERRGGTWAIAARICVLDGYDNLLDPDGTVGDGPFFRTTRDGSDPSYMRPLMVDKSRITG